jgi:hypothetical protein
MKPMVEPFILSRNKSQKIKLESISSCADRNIAILLGLPQLELEGERENMQ